MKNKDFKLDELKIKHPFKAPEGYFEELPSVIQSRIPSGEEHRPWFVWSWWGTVKLAGAAVVILSLVWLTLPVRQGPLEPDALLAVSDDAILEYLKSQDMDFYDLAHQGVVQEAFKDESTLINYLDEVDESVIRQQLIENSSPDDNI